MTTISLCMICRNEAAIIERCLESVCRLVDYVFIVDTGSTDGTQDAVRRWLDRTGIRGEVIDEPWRDFAYNRTFALAKLREKSAIDYSLMLDADQVIEFDKGFDVDEFKSGLDRDLYDVKVSSGSVVYLLPQLARNGLEIVYRGVLHEYRECPEGFSRGLAQGFLIKELHDSARGNEPGKYARDVATFEAALASETDPFLVSRYRFYLAQSYRDAGLLEPAIKTYLERANLGGWDQEVFYSLYSVAKMKEQLGHPEDEIVEAYLAAHRICPSRVEPIYAAAQFLRKLGRYEEGYGLARKYLYQPPPTSGLFVETWIFDHGLLDEFSVLAFWSGRYAECVDACMRILDGGKLAQSEHVRVRQNAHFAIEKLGTAPTAQGSVGSAAVPESSAELPNPPVTSFANAASAIARPPIATSRYAIITPYYKEDRKTFERCLRSVSKQTVHVDHIVVADGFPQSWIDDEPVRHIRLDAAHADFGGTPRGLGALMAVSEGYEGIGFLDADNWLAPDHVARCIETASQQTQQPDFIIARRHLMTPDEVPLDMVDGSSDLVDTNCYFYLPSSYPALHHWVTMPKPLTPIGDRIFLAAAAAYGLHSAQIDQPTVFYQTLWSANYEAAGFAVPSNAKPNVDMMPAQIWLDSLSAEEMHLANKLAGSVLRDPEGLAAQTARNAKCPCGSGKRYKHCHGAFVV